jgi:ribosomal protein L7/L12
MSEHYSAEELMLRTIIDISRDNAFQEVDILALEDQVRTLTEEKSSDYVSSLERRLEAVQKTFEGIMKNPGGKISMIKLHRAIFNSGLKDSKNAVEKSELWNRCKVTKLESWKVTENGE